MRATLFQLSDLFMALHSPKMAMNNHDFSASRTRGGFCGRVSEDEARIRTGPERVRKTEKENRCLTFKA